MCLRAVHERYTSGTRAVHECISLMHPSDTATFTRHVSRGAPPENHQRAHTHTYTHTHPQPMDSDRTDSDDETTDAPIALPKGVSFHKKASKYFMQFTRGGKRHTSPYSKDMAVLVKWRVDTDKELDAAGVPAARKYKERTPAAHQSTTPGVCWHSKNEKWGGQCFDRLVTAADAKTKQLHTSSFALADEAECAAALQTLRAAEHTRFEAEMAKRKAADRLLDGLERAPAACKDADASKVYWHVDANTKYVPYRAVVSGGQYFRACIECSQRAVANTPGGAPTHCKQHGGGKRCLGPGKCGVCAMGVSVPLGKADRFDGRCPSCFVASFPNDPRAESARSSLHAKEYATRAVLEKAFPDYNWVFDTKFTHRICVVGSRARPDARFTLADRVIIVEIDEHSHRAYLCAKEREREASFVVQNRGKTVVMIRFNPDAYTDYAGVRQPSCFTRADKDHQIVHVHPAQKAQWERRLAELVCTITNLANPKFKLPPKQSDRPLLICELFYDNVNAIAEDKRVNDALAGNKAIGKRKRKLAASTSADVG